MDQLLYRAEELQQLLRVGRSKIYELMASGELPTVHIGRSVRVPASALETWLSETLARESRIIEQDETAGDQSRADAKANEAALAEAKRRVDDEDEEADLNTLEAA